MKTALSTLVLLLVLLAAGCAPAPQATPTPETGLPALGLDRLDQYSSSMMILFDGPKKWVYQTDTRKTPTLRETRLHIEGVEAALNPGDIRLVTDGTTSWMTGEGTQNECILFPNGEGMDPTWIDPEALAGGPDVLGQLKLIGEEQNAGRESLHYSAGGLNAGPWTDAQMDVWVEKASGALLQFNLAGNGEDPYFGGGSGRLMARYVINGFEAGEIQPVTGCEISAPLPEGAAKYVRLPGLASFESAAGIEEISQFYQQQLPQQGWSELEPPVQNEGAVVLRYQKDPEELEIHVERGEKGESQVKLLFFPVE